MTAYVCRFCHNLRIMSKQEPEAQGTYNDHLAANEIQDAEEYWTRQAQNNLLERMDKGDFKTLSPFIDEKAIIRVGGCVDPNLWSYEGKYPARLPHDHWMSTFITREVHQVGHLGVAVTTAKIRRNYWIIKGNSIAKIVKQRCSFCREMEAKVETQQICPLVNSLTRHPFCTPHATTLDQ